MSGGLRCQEEVATVVDLPRQRKERGKDMGYNIETLHRVECLTYVVDGCHHDEIYREGSPADAEQAFSNSGWDKREGLWLCPSCVAAYDVNAKKENNP
jgi:hypothetical protein